MKEFLKDMLIEPFLDRGWTGYILGVVMWFFALIIVGGLLLLSIWLIDSTYLPLKEKQGVVTEHYYIPAHTTTTFIMIGKVMVPQIHYYDDSFEITVEIDGLTDNVCLYKNSWDETKVGDKFCFKYTNGRICKSLYIKSFCE